MLIYPRISLTISARPAFTLFTPFLHFTSNSLTISASISPFSFLISTAIHSFHFIRPPFPFHHILRLPLYPNSLTHSSRISLILLSLSTQNSTHSNSSRTFHSSFSPLSPKFTHSSHNFFHSSSSLLTKPSLIHLVISLILLPSLPKTHFNHLNFHVILLLPLFPKFTQFISLSSRSFPPSSPQTHSTSSHISHSSLSSPSLPQTHFSLISISLNPFLPHLSPNSLSSKESHFFNSSLSLPLQTHALTHIFSHPSLPLFPNSLFTLTFHLPSFSPSSTQTPLISHFLHPSPPLYPNSLIHLTILTQSFFPSPYHIHSSFFFPLYPKFPHSSTLSTQFFHTSSTKHNSPSFPPSSTQIHYNGFQPVIHSLVSSG
ncbi:hypothetical protein C7M84_014878 [Penaeus vannamei]|uniref:Uncharacterized protein n=1 Tax=Penaeus vannamei TaxID=6689 RepID=A0A423SS92_PENVA|nr:hypothetical protein C7M84_014878 [Penaeus vannamei]